MIKVIKQSKKYGDLEIILDEEGIELYRKNTWHIVKHGKTFYLRTNLKVKGKYYCKAFHRELLQLNNQKEVVDHINGNGLDNRKENLRICLQSENIKNQVRIKTKPWQSKYKGVFWNKKNKNWRSMIGVNGKRINIGSFTSEHAAAVAYNIEAKRQFGKFANLNKIGSTK